MWALAGAIALAVGVVLVWSTSTSPGGQPTPTPCASCIAVPAALGLPALEVPRGDIGVRMRFGKKALLVIGLGPAPKNPLHPLKLAPFRVISTATGRVWRLRTNTQGRAQVAVPPGRYDVKLGWARSAGFPWTFDAVRDRAVREGRTLTPSFIKYTALP